MNRNPEALLAAIAATGGFREYYEERTRASYLENDTGRIERCMEVSDGGAALRSFDGGDLLFSATNCLADGELATEHLRSSAPVAIAAGGPWPPPVEPCFDSAFDSRLAVTTDIYNRLKGTITGLVNARISVSRYVKQYRIANTAGTATDSAVCGERFALHLTIEEGAEKFTVYESAGFTGRAVTGDEIERIVGLCIGRVATMRVARPCPAGVFPCILAAEAGGTLIHEAVGHGLEADLVDKGVSVYRGRIGELIASTLVTVVDDATVPQGWGSFPVDDEGTPAQRTVLVDKGVLRCFLADRYYAGKLGVAPTGNGRRQSYRHKPVTRMTNTSILPGADDPAALLASLDKGLLVKRMGGGQVNPLTGDFIFEVSEGWWVEGGVPQHPVKNCSLIGNGPAVLSEIDGVGSDFGTAIGTCGKEGQGVPVGDGQPTIRIPRITVGGTQA